MTNKYLEKIDHRWLYALAVIVIIILLLVWYFHGVPDSRKTDDVINSLREPTKTTERRAGAVINATRQREASARAKAKKKTAALHDDQLVTALNDLLASYRNGKDAGR